MPHYHKSTFLADKAVIDVIWQAKSTDRDKLTANKLTANQRFCYSDFVTDFVVVISSRSEGLGKMALGIVKIYLGSPFSPSSVVRGQFVRGQFVAVGCRGPVIWFFTTQTEGINYYQLITVILFCFFSLRQSQVICKVYWNFLSLKTEQ